MSPSDLLRNLDGVPHEVEVAIPGPRIRVSKLLALGRGDVLNADYMVGENIPVFAGGVRIGAGELSNVDRHLVLRIVHFGGGR